MLSTLHDTSRRSGSSRCFQLEFNLTTLAAILTIAGYSVNDTVVIYDRVRETMRKYRTMPLIDLINMALNETLSRTILTVSTVALAVLSLLIFGGAVLRGFSIAMLWGVVIGTYSSLFIAAPILYYMQPNRASIAAPARDRQGRRRTVSAVELTPLVPPGRQIIERYGPGGFRVSGVVYRRRAGVPRPHPGLGPDGSAAVTLDSLSPVIEHGEVRILLLGLGRRTAPVAADLRAGLRARGIALEPMDTGAACRTFNLLVAEDRQVAAALLPPV